MALNVPGVVVMVFFYLMVLGTGIWASFKSKKEIKNSSVDPIDMALLGNRGISLVVGMFTMTATWIGGGFFSTLAEVTYIPSSGVKEAVLIVSAYTTAFIICGFVFTKPMRDRRFVTMLDPFHIKYGKGVACLFTVISLITDFIWVPTTLISLDSAQPRHTPTDAYLDFLPSPVLFPTCRAVMHVILDVSYTVSIWISAAVAITYTLLGGLYSVAYTDVIQIILMFLGSWLCVPFVLMIPAASDVSNTTLHLNTSGGYPPWLGDWEEGSLLVKVDTFLFMVLGCQAIQPVQQRILSSLSSDTARHSCFFAALAVIIFAIPPAIVGGVAITAALSKYAI
ncbi:High affinity choline transporter 1 [Merluccius polli]|uniref:High affinity choline transporter 1 n=1 Tax=Merluccius polli TaxID=89951 RepID=A0AA47NU23_MERPO|nr:High affinity choline transporter 1 [Merluccius polli]